MARVRHIAAYLTCTTVLASFCFKPAEATEGARSLHLKFSVTTQDTHLTHKFLFPFAIPRGFAMTAVKGTISTTSEWTHVSETLFSINISNTAKCPTVEEDLPDYTTIFTKYPEFGLTTLILKELGPGIRTEKVDLHFPLPVPLSNSCGFVTLDGSDFKNLPYKMAIDVQLSIVAQTAPAGDLRYGDHDEYNMSDNNQDNALSIQPVWADAKLYAIAGNVTAATSPLAPQKLPKGTWKVVHEILLYPGGCSVLKSSGTNNPHLVASMAGKTIVYQTTIVGNGGAAYYRQINPVFNSPLPLKKGDCIVHTVQGEHEGSVDAGIFNTEAQMFYETVNENH